jgi:hypothetical protein
MWKSWVNVYVGIWAVLSGIVIVLATPVNFFITGAVVAFFGFWVAYSRHWPWQSVANGILGLWLVLSAFAPQLAIPTNLLIVGVIVAGLAAWHAISVQPTQQPIK